MAVKKKVVKNEVAEEATSEVVEKKGKKPAITTLEMLKAEMLRVSKGATVMALEDEEPGVWLTSPAYDLNRILSGDLFKSVQTKNHIGIVGPEACLDEDTHIHFETWVDGKRNDHKGSKIKNLYKRFHNKSDNVEFKIMSINENDCVFGQDIVDVVKTGVKKCYELTTIDGYKIVTSEDHKFYVGNQQYLPLKDLSVDDIIYIHTNVRNKKPNKNGSRKEICVKYHPNNRKKEVNGCLYYRIRSSILAYEAYLNNMTIDEYRCCLNRESIDYINKLKTVDTDLYDVHHIDENPDNDSENNLLLLEKSEHYRYHSKKDHNNLRYVVYPDIIKSIEYVGERETYDIKCLYPYNNYIANNIVVHNSGKSSFMAIMLADAQKKGYLPVVIDAEGAWTKDFVTRWGLDDSNIIKVKSMWVDDIMVTVSEWISAGYEKLAIAVDSIGALDVKKILEDGAKGDIKTDMGKLQREIKRLLKMLVNLCKNNNCICFSAGHYYGNSSGYGDPEQIGGGKYYRLSCDQIISLKKSQLFENPSAAGAARGKVLGNKIMAATLKNRTYPPFQEATVHIDFKNGVNSLAGIIDLAMGLDIIIKSGSWYTCESLGIKAQGETKLMDEMKDKDITPMLDAINDDLKKSGYSTVNRNIEQALAISEE